MRLELQRSAKWWGLIVLATVASFAGTDATQLCAAESRELGKIKVKQLSEASGIAASRRNAYIFWLHNDGDSGKLFAVRASGKLAAEIKCPIPVTDVEDIAIGPGPTAGVDYVYLGDVGDNNASRDSLQIVRFPEPNLSDTSAGRVDKQAFERIRLQFPDGPHDCETLLVDPAHGDLCVVTKEPGRARIYTVPAAELKDGATVELLSAGTVSVADVSAGDVSPDGKWIVLRQEAAGWLWPRRPSDSIAAALAGKFEVVPVRGDRQGPNGEGITFSADGSGYVTVSEGKNQAICEFSMPAHSSD